jgi:hypothetical protein
MLGAYKYISFAPSDVTGPEFTSPAAGSVGTFVVGRSLATFSSNITIAATDPEGNNVSFTEPTSALSGIGLTLTDNSDGTATISGTPSLVTSETTTNFTIRATDDFDNSTDRSFNITISPNYFGDSSDGAFSNQND